MVGCCDMHDGDRQQQRHIRFLVPYENPTTDTKVPIKPGMPEATPIRFDTNLDAPRSRPLRTGFDLEVRRVRVSTNNLDTVSWLVLFADGKRHNRRFVPGKVVLATCDKKERVDDHHKENENVCIRMSVFVFRRTPS